MQRRRRRNRGTWFPILPFNFGGEGYANSTTDSRIVGVAAAAGEHTLQAIPFLPDETPDIDLINSTTDTTLRDYVEGQAYILERVVGTVQWNMAQINSNEGPSRPHAVACCTALAILPVNDEDQTPAIPPAEWDPLEPANSAQPWIWRRVWYLADNLSNSGLTSDRQTYLPSGNNEYGSMREGTHIDTKGARRRVMREQRLFLIHATHSVDGADSAAGGEARVNTDIRIFASMVKQRNRSTFK